MKKLLLATVFSTVALAASARELLYGVTTDDIEQIIVCFEYNAFGNLDDVNILEAAYALTNADSEIINKILFECSTRFGINDLNSLIYASDQAKIHLYSTSLRNIVSSNMLPSLSEVE